MLSIKEVASTTLDALSALLKASAKFFEYLRLVGHREALLNSSRMDFQSFWEIWYSSSAAVEWIGKFLYDEGGLLDNIRGDAELRSAMRDALSNYAANSSKAIGDLEGNYGLTFALKHLTAELPNHSDFVLNFWQFTHQLILLMSDALRVFPDLFR